jgi:hypothetical protein
MTAHGNLNMRFCILFFCGLMANLAHASTVTFSGIPDRNGGPSSYSEDGIDVNGNGAIGNLSADKAVHMDSGGTGYASTLEFSMSGLFDAVSFDISPVNFKNDLAFGDTNNGQETRLYDVPFKNVLVQGFRNGSVVVSDLFNMLDFPAFAFSTYSLDGFENLDMLSVGFGPVPTAGDFIYPPGTDWTAFTCDSPCSHYNMDNVMLSPVAAVPLPAGFPLLLAGLGAIGFTRKRRLN